MVRLRAVGAEASRENVGGTSSFSQLPGLQAGGTRTTGAATHWVAPKCHLPNKILMCEWAAYNVLLPFKAYSPKVPNTFSRLQPSGDESAMKF